jgi:hypothetical protein
MGIPALIPAALRREINREGLTLALAPKMI